MNIYGAKAQSELWEDNGRESESEFQLNLSEINENHARKFG
jgi:hypothetical protein